MTLRSSAQAAKHSKLGENLLLNLAGLKVSSQDEDIDWWEFLLDSGVEQGARSSMGRDRS